MKKRFTKSKGLYLRKNVWWMTYIGPDGSQRWESCHTQNKTEAQALLENRRVAVREGKLPETKRYRNIAFTELAKDYKKGKSCLSVLRGIDFSFDKGDFLSIVGASGAGKSTLLHILGGLDKPTRGEVLYECSSVFSKSEE